MSHFRQSLALLPSAELTNAQAFAMLVARASGSSQTNRPRCIQQPLTQGVPVIVLPKFEEKLFLTSIEKYRITWALLVPPILVLLANSPSVDQYDVSSLRGIISGAAPLGRDLALKVANRLKERCFVIQGYGASLFCLCS